MFFFVSGLFEQNLRRGIYLLFFSNLFVITIDGSLHHAMERFSREGTKHEPAWSKPRLQTGIGSLKKLPPSTKEEDMPIVLLVPLSLELLSFFYRCFILLSLSLVVLLVHQLFMKLGME